MIFSISNNISSHGFFFVFYYNILHWCYANGEKECKGRYTLDNCLYCHAQLPVLKTPTPLLQLRRKLFHQFDIGRSILNDYPSLQLITNQLKENIIQGLLLHVIWPFLQVGSRFQYLLINLVWLSIDFFSFNQSRPQSNFKKLKISFLLSSYNKKMCWGQDWAEASLSTFSRLYIFVCAVAQKYQKTFFF